MAANTINLPDGFVLDKQPSNINLPEGFVLDAPTEPFDPEGSGYDYESAIKAGIKPDETGHWASRDPVTGLILKGRGHETFHKTIAGEEAAGYEIYKGEDGRYYSRPKPKSNSLSRITKDAFDRAGKIWDTSVELEVPLNLVELNMPLYPGEPEDPYDTMPHTEVPEKNRMNLLERAGKQYANKLALETIEQNRPSSAAVESLGIMSKALQDAGLEDDMTFWEQVKSIPKLWWALTKSYYSPKDKAEREVAHTALKQLRPELDFDIPQAETVGEKTVDVGAGIGAFVSKLLITKKVLPPNTVLSDAVAWEIVNQAEGGIPGQGAAMQGSLGLIGSIPTHGAKGTVLKLFGEGGLFAGMTAAEGGDIEDIAVSFLVPAALKAIRSAPGWAGETELGHKAVKKFSGKFPRTADVIRSKPSPEAVKVTEKWAKERGYKPKTATAKEKAAINIVAREVDRSVRKGVSSKKQTAAPETSTEIIPAKQTPSRTAAELTKTPLPTQTAQEKQITPRRLARL